MDDCKIIDEDVLVDITYKTEKGQNVKSYIAKQCYIKEDASLGGISNGQHDVTIVLRDITFTNETIKDK